MVDITTLSNPFPGLRSYEYEDNSLFFGRESHIHELRSKLLDARFLALIGSSGSGKSSLIKAGLVPSLEDLYEIKAGWKVLVFRPGATPIRNLVSSLKINLRREDARWEGADPEEVEKELLANPQLILELLAVVKRRNILLVIDQFEEIFRFGHSENTPDGGRQGAEFIDLLISLINQRELPVHVVITMRSDYLDHCTEYKGLTEMINRGYYLLPKMNQEEIRQIIVKPIELYGAKIEPELVQVLLQKLSDNPDFLPILQHAMMRTWDRWKATSTAASPLSMAEYTAIGAMEDSITQHAEEIFAQKLDEKRRFAAEKLFKTLIVLGPSDTPSLHPTSLREIQKISGVPDYLLVDVVLVFRENGVSFLTPRPGIKVDDDAIIDVAVERVLTLWERSKVWIEEELESAKLYKQLSYSAFLYQEGRTGLWVNPELQVGLRWLNESEPTLEWAQRYDPFFERALNFLDYSKKQYDQEVQHKEDRQKRELRKARTFATVLGASSLISLLFLIVAMVLRTQAEQSEKTALEKERLALTERKRAEDQTREAIAQKKIAEQQGVIADLQKSLTEEQRTIAVREQEKAIKESIAAKSARQIAEEQTVEADNARQEAVVSQRETEIQREFALIAQKESDKQKVNAQKAQKDAELSRNDALRQRSKAIARFIAIQSYQMPAGDELAALLALRGYDFNVRNGGERDNPDVFNALSKAAGAKNTFMGHNDIVRIVAEQPEQAGKAAFVSAGDDGTLNVWDANAPTARPVSLRAARQTFKSIRSAVFAPGGNTLFVGTSNGQLIRWDSFVAGSQPTKMLIGHEGVVLRVFVRSEAGKPRLISVSSIGQLRIWDIGEKKLDVLKNISLGAEISCVDLTSDGRYLFAVTIDSQVLRIDLDNPDKKVEKYDFRRIRGRITALNITGKGDEIYLGSSAGTLYTCTVRGGVPIVSTLIGYPGGHSSGITKIAFSPDGMRVATASYDAVIKIWNLQEDLSKQQPVTLTDFDSWVMDVRFTRDGKKLLAAGADKSVRIWDINSAALFDQVSSKVTRDLTDEEWEKYIGKDIPFEKIARTNR
jgi:WD40 repeat protein/energy-coupling factor transporter ATP-binding protein EcfA2